MDSLVFMIDDAFLNDTETGAFFVTHWVVYNRDNKKRQIRLSENPEESYILYGHGAQKLPVKGIGVGTCDDGNTYCNNKLNVLPGQKISFVIKTQPRRMQTDRVVTASIRARFKIEEEGFFDFPIDLEFTNVAFKPENWAAVYGKHRIYK